MTTRTGTEPTLHQKILNDIEGRIVSGEWQPGFHLPFEVDLAARYGCSRMTVNKVMTQLAKAGLIERHRKAGSFVSQPRAQSAILEIHDVEAEVRSLNLPYAYTLVSRRLQRADEEDRRNIDVGDDVSLLKLVAVHHAGGKPFCIERRIINTSAVKEAATVDFTTTPPGPWLISKVPWTSAEHRIHAVAASAEDARLLGLRKGTACLLIERRTWSPAGAITFVRFTYPGERHTLVARFTPAQSTSSGRLS